uniref:Putative aminotransferase n=1 Tax=Juglanconis oblonga TaxID=1940568 RepID=A0A291LI72_9PEZI|nr:putative aminotransferase [Juglanconis oblonga]
MQYNIIFWIMLISGKRMCDIFFSWGTVLVMFSLGYFLLPSLPWGEPCSPREETSSSPRGASGINLYSRLAISSPGEASWVIPVKSIRECRRFSNSVRRITVGKPRSYSTDSASFGRHLTKEYPKIVGGKGKFLFTSDSRKIFDASSGAAVSCLGHGNKRINMAIRKQLKTGTTYLASTFWVSAVVEELCNKLIEGTEGKMARVYLTGSGSEAMEAAIKLARQYFYEIDKNTVRVNFIAREGSYHGNTIGALAISGHLARRAPYTPLLMKNVYHISSCNPYRQRKEGESDAAFVARKAAELEAKFQELGPETVIGFIAEPVVGAALGCVPYVPGYLKAMRDVCHKYGALFILDEVMCGMGRTGTLHAWQAENIVPDIQTMGKGLGAGYQPIAAMMISPKIVNVVKEGSGQFIHGQTYQSMPIQAAAALEVLRIIQEDNLLDNVTKLGVYFEQALKAVLGDHPNVGNIRGQGLFLGIEFVKAKESKEPFHLNMGIASKILDMAISPQFNMTVYPGTGTVDGVHGDHIILAPPYIITKKDVDHIIKVVSSVVHLVFKHIK